jgi:hypothetical protein
VIIRAIRGNKKTGGKNRPCHMRKILLRIKIAYYLLLYPVVVTQLLNSITESSTQESFMEVNYL